MKSLLSPTLDLVFKNLFVKRSTLLVDLINTVLELPEHRRVSTVDIKNPIIVPEDIAEKYIILDIRATDNSGNHYDVEMQAQTFKAYSKRALYYLAKIYAEQLKHGENYYLLNPVIGIHFLNYNLYPAYDDFHFHFHFRDSRHTELIIEEDVSLHVFELPKIKRIERENPRPGGMEEWLHFFRYGHKEVDKKMRMHYTNPAVQEAFVVLEEMSADEKARHLAEMRERALKNKISELGAARKEGLEEGLEKGLEKGIKKTAVNMISMGAFSMEQISQATGLKVDDVKSLRDARQAEAA